MSHPHVLVTPYTETATPVVHPLRLTAMLSITLSGEEIAKPSYRHLIEGNLHIRAWSYAQLVLWGTDGDRQQQQVIQLGVDGHLSLPWRDTALATLTSDTLRIQLLWNDLPVSQTITFAVEEATLLPDAVEIAFRADIPDTLDLIAELPLWKPGARILILVLGQQPWDNQIWSQYVSVARDGMVTTSIGTSHKDARWLIICMQYTGQKPMALVAKRIGEVAQLPIWSPCAPAGPSLRQWNDIAGFLSAIPLPSDLYRLVQQQQVYQLLSREEVQRLTKSRWEEVATAVQVERLMHWLQLGARTPHALCEWLPSEDASNSHASVLIPNDLAAFQSLLDNPGSTIGLREILSSGAQYFWMDGELYSVDDEGETKLRIRSKSLLRTCNNCRVVLPNHSFDRHQHLCRPGICCPDQIILLAHREPRVYLVALFDNRELLHVVARHLQAIVAENTENLPDTIATLLNEKLYPYFELSGLADERTWLSGLYSALETLARSLAGPHSHTLTSQDIKSLLLYQGALLAIVQWTQEL